MTLKSLKGIKHQATYGNVHLAIGDRIHAKSRFGTAGEGTITGFRDVQDQTFIRVRLDEGAEFHPYDKWDLKKGVYDRLQDIGVSFNEIKILQTGVKPKNTRKKKLTNPEVVQESSNDSRRTAIAVKASKPTKKPTKKVATKAIKKPKVRPKVSEPA